MPVRQPGGGAPAAPGRPSPAEPRGRRLRAAREALHLARRPGPAALRLRARTRRLRRGDAAGERRAPPRPLRLLFTGGRPAADPGAAPHRARRRRAPSSRARASPPGPLTLCCAGRAAGGERAVQAARGAPEGTCGRGAAGRGGDPARAPPRANCLGARPRCAREGGGRLEPRGGRAHHGRGGSGSWGSAPRPPACAWRPPSTHCLSRAVSQLPRLGLEPAGRCAASPPRACPRSPPQAQRLGLAPPGLEPGTPPPEPTQLGPGAEG